MTRTSLDIVTQFYKAIKDTALITGPSKVNGGLYKNKRPVNSIKEDVVVNSLPINYRQLQEAVLNLNIHVPNLSIPLNGITDNSQPNLARLTELTTIAVNTLAEINSPDGEYSFILQQDNLFEGDNNDHYINLRFEFSSINI